MAHRAARTDLGLSMIGWRADKRNRCSCAQSSPAPEPRCAPRSSSSMHWTIAFTSDLRSLGCTGRHRTLLATKFATGRSEVAAPTLPLYISMLLING